MIQTSPRVLHVAAEIFPFLKTGGLADVVGALPSALTTLGVDLRLLLPGMPAILDALEQPRRTATLGAVFGAGEVRLLRGRLSGIDADVYVIDSPWLYRRDGGPYQDTDGREWQDNLQRFALLGWTAAHMAAGEFDWDWTPELVHAHDWHAALACCYIAAHPGARAKSVFTVHNLAYQGNFATQDFPVLGLPRHFAQPFGALEFHGDLSFMKGGLACADHVTTVSPTYAREIATAAFGCGLEGVVASRAGQLTGILNGIDTSVWDPETDSVLSKNYSADALGGKRDCKRALQREFGLDENPDAVLFGVVSRMSAQKGLDLLHAALPAILSKDVQLVLLGSGDADLQEAFRNAASAHPRRIGVCIGYDEALAHRVIAGADVIMVPSRFEPCGLTQLYGLRYGTLPLVRRVGGLTDTVDGTVGFGFDAADPTDLAATTLRAIEVFRQPARWRVMQRAAMSRDHGWGAAAVRYLELYRSLLQTG